MLPSDRQCIEQCLNGHPDDYGQLVRRYQAALLSYLAGRLGNREWAEEAAQETFVRAYFNLNKLKKPDSFFSWLLGIAGHVAKEQLRLQERQQVLARISAARPPAPEFSGDYALEKGVAELPDEALNFYPTSEMSPRMKYYLGGLEIISVGTPFKSGSYPGWFVPYEIRLKIGEVKKHNLALRNDNRAQRYLVDGGI